MNEYVNGIKNMITMFSQIVTGVCVVSALYVSFFWGWDAEVDIAIIWQILFVSAICTLGSFFCSCRERELTKEQMRLRMFLSFLYVNCVVLFFGFCFQWFYISEWKMVLGMEAAIILVFMFVTGISYQADSKVADKLNSRLQERKK